MPMLGKLAFRWVEHRLMENPGLTSGIVLVMLKSRDNF